MSALFNSGADQPLTYNLNTVTTGLPTLTSGGVAVTYAVSGNTLTASAGANTVFTFALNGTTGAWTFTLVGHLDHAAGADENNLTINLSSIVRATDSDSDTVTAGATGLVITVNDDTPVIGAVQDAILSAQAGTEVTGTWQPLFGADGALAANPLSITLGAAPAGYTYSSPVPAGLSPTGDQVVKIDVQKSGATVYSIWEYTHYDPATHTETLSTFLDAGLTTSYYNLSMNTNGTYTFAINSVPTFTTTLDFTALSPTIYNAIYVVDGVIQGKGYVPPSGVTPDVIIDSYNDLKNGTSADNVQVNNNGLGLNNGNLDNGETVGLKFAQTQTAISLLVGKAQAGNIDTFVVTLYNGGVAVGQETVTLVGAGTATRGLLFIDADHWGTSWGIGNTSVVNSGSFGAFDSVSIEKHASGLPNEDSKVTLDALNYQTTTVINTSDLHFNIAITDGDQDTTSTTAANTLDITLDANHLYTATASAEWIHAGSIGGADTVNYSGQLSQSTGVTYVGKAVTGVIVDLSDNSHNDGLFAKGDTIVGVENVTGTQFNDVLIGDSGTNILTGGAGDDILIGGLGADILAGGTGNDTFVLTSIAAIDVIADFQPGTGLAHDTIDLTALLNAATGVTTANLNSYVTYNQSTGALSLDLNGATGGANFTPVVQIDTTSPSTHPTTGTVQITYEDTAHAIHTTTV